MIYMFNEFLGVVTTPQFVMNAVDLAICYDENTIYEEDYPHNFEIACRDLFLFEIDMMAERHHN